MTIDSRTLYATLLGLKAPWEITDVEMKQPPGEVHIRVALPESTLWVCPQCSSAAPIHDHQERHWRHLDTCQFPTIVHARVPRLKCPLHGIKQLPVPWAEVGSRFTAMFEALAIDWLRHASVKAVAQQMRISTHRITNAGAESINAKIQAAKRRACGFRNRDRFRTAIYFHCGGLDLYPACAGAGS